MNESTEPIRVQVSGSVRVVGALGAQASGPGGNVKGVRVVDANGQRLSADVLDNGSVQVRIEGQGIPGTLDEVPACKILVDRFNNEGGRWAEPEPRPKAERENGVDVLARHLQGGKPLQFQVTRVDPDKKLWAELIETRVAEKIYPSIGAVADALRDAILKKLHRPQEGIILVLNGTQLPIGLPSVRDSFGSRHGAWLREQLRFEQVWVVESFQDNPWTFQLS